jgi:predicted DNA-binding protein
MAEETKVLYLRLPSKLYDRLEGAAKERGQGMTALAREILHTAIKEYAHKVIGK